MPPDFSKSLNVGPRFRNDDVSFDTELEFFRPFCEIFWKHGFIQTHAVTLNGLCNYKHRHRGSYCVYEGLPTLSYLSNREIREASRPYPFRERRDLIDFLNASPDDIALHGLYHLDFSTMDEEEQFAEMAAGLEELQRLFPAKPIRFFVPPFNKYNRNTLKAANRLGLRVLGDEGVHLEESLDRLDLYPGIWYRYHHHRFYPGSTYDTVELSLERLDAGLAAGVAHYCQGRLPLPSFDYEGDVHELEKLVRRHNAQEWYLGTALDRRDRHELVIAMGWIYSHVEYAQSIFEVGCGAGNNLHWLSVHGYENVGGSDVSPQALAVARDMAAHEGFYWRLQEGSLLDASHIPQGTDVVLAVNCVLYLPDFDLATFLAQCARRLSENGYIVMDQVDASFNGHPLQAVHTTQWGLPPSAWNRESEYKKRTTRAEVAQIAAEQGFDLVAALPSFQQIPRVLYIFGKGDARGIARRPLPALKIPEADVQPAMNAIFNAGLFDFAWYREQYVHGPEVINPLEHYVRFGAANGRWPNPRFDTDAYRRRHMQLDDPTNPLVHWLQALGAERSREEDGSELLGGTRPS